MNILKIFSLLLCVGLINACNTPMYEPKHDPNDTIVVVDRASTKVTTVPDNLAYVSTSTRLTNLETRMTAVEKRLTATEKRDTILGTVGRITIKKISTGKYVINIDPSYKP